ncbi:MAG: isocitrate dehydrogenase kinase/phosphatase-domain containing protein, partial [Bacteroidota bacterium]
RKMTPLNLFLKRATQAEIEEVVDEYGQTIRQLASVNIFPGDMLLKNFGLTRHQRVVFYDYDEIGFLTEYNFREMPKAQSPEEVYAAGPWFAVGPKDVFPEEFRHFLIGFSGMEEIFVKLHADLFTVEFWLEMQARQVRGEIMDIFPYREKKRFIHQPSAD